MRDAWQSPPLLALLFSRIRARKDGRLSLEASLMPVGQSQPLGQSTPRDQFAKEHKIPPPSHHQCILSAAPARIPMALSAPTKSAIGVMCCTSCPAVSTN